MLARVALCLILLLLIAPAAAQEPETPALERQLAAIRSMVSEMRQLDPLRDAPLNLPSSAETEAFLRHRFARDHSAESLDADLYFYRALDLAEAGIDLEAMLLAHAIAWVGGYYSLEADSLNIVVGERGPALTIPQQTIYAHEWIHALQDQHYDLDRIIDAARAGDRDQRLALFALIEGDANLIMSQFLNHWLRKDRAAAQRAFANVPQPEIDPHLPPVIAAATRFPYEAGQRFVHALLHARGLEGLDAALRDNPPQTTEQIYHPERYLKGEGALQINMPDVSAIVGDGWTLVYDGPVGEFYLRQHLAPFIHEARLHNLTTEGWGGDQMQVYAEAEGDELAWALNVAWDSQRDAAEFAGDYRAMLRKHYGRGTAVGICFSGESVRCIAPVGAREIRIAQANDADLARSLLRARA